MFYLHYKRLSKKLKKKYKELRSNQDFILLTKGVLIGLAKEQLKLIPENSLLIGGKISER